jgi:hypothetical protein
MQKMSGCRATWLTAAHVVAVRYVSPCQHSSKDGIVSAVLNPEFQAQGLCLKYTNAKKRKRQESDRHAMTQI